MFVDIWILAIFSLVVGLCAVWNRYRGFRDGVIGTVEALEDQNIIKIADDGEILPYRKPLR